MRHRSDDTQKEIVRALRAAHVLVWLIARPCDALCKRGTNLYLIDFEGSTKYRKRDPAQLAAFQTWDIKIVKTPDEALRAVGVIA